MAVPSVHASDSPSLSPIETLEKEIQVILSANKLEDLIDLIPEEHRSRLGELSAERKQQMLTEWQAGVEGLTFEERIEGTKAAVLQKDPRHEEGVLIKTMELEDGQWVSAGQMNLILAVPRARGSFVLRGAEKAEVKDAIVTQTFMNGAPVLIIRDELSAAITEDGNPSITLGIGRCLEPGRVALGPSDPAEMTVGSKVRGAGEDATSYGQDPSGELRVAEVEGDRFSGTFEFTVMDEDGNQVEVSGSFESASNPCDE